VLGRDVQQLWQMTIASCAPDASPQELIDALDGCDVVPAFARSAGVLELRGRIENADRLFLSRIKNAAVRVVAAFEEHGRNTPARAGGDIVSALRSVPVAAADHLETLATIMRDMLPP
jgi:hypothetical protein